MNVGGRESLKDFFFMSNRYKSMVLQHISNRTYEAGQMRKIAEDLGVPAEDFNDFQNVVRQLVDAGQVVIGTGEKIALPPMGKVVTGKIRVHEKGFGFIIPDVASAHGDLFVPGGMTGGALSGDRVRADVVKRQGPRDGGKSPFVGSVTEVLERGKSRFVGVLQMRGKLWVVIPDGKILTDPIVVRDPGAKHAPEGAKVVVELTRYPEANATAEGVITEVLGEHGDPGAETLGICRAYGLAESFPDEVVDEARGVVIDYQSAEDSGDSPWFKGRLDLRSTYIITIDPPDAQDYDDAISLEMTDKGMELGVHIADVSAFVKRGGPLDAEALKRGNSAYLPRRVVPMLPEVLSNGICSLQPGVPRLTKSAFITYDDKGAILRRRFANSVIQSAHRLTYIEAQALIDGDLELARKHAKYDGPYTDQLRQALLKMNELATAIRKRRLEAGMIVLDLPEVELIYDDKGSVVDAQPEDTSFTHQLIEAFMVEANEAVAGVFADMDFPLIRRIHPDPGQQDVAELRRFARVAGYTIPENPSRKELQRLLDSVRGKPASKAVHFAVLRTLTKAEYSPEVIGHFALASVHYTHFTSPIRRYPDLTVHRALEALLDLNGSKPIPRAPAARRHLARDLAEDPRCMDHEQLVRMGAQCSATERNAESAERELRSLLVMQLMAKHVGDVYQGTVTGVTNWGVYIQIDKFLVEGLIRLKDLPGSPADRWRLNEFTGSLVAQRSGKRLSVGDSLKVKINQVDLARREMQLLIDNPRALKGPESVTEPAQAAAGPRDDAADLQAVARELLGEAPAGSSGAPRSGKGKSARRGSGKMGKPKKAGKGKRRW